MNVITVLIITIFEDSKYLHCMKLATVACAVEFLINIGSANHPVETDNMMLPQFIAVGRLFMKIVYS